MRLVAGFIAVLLVCLARAQQYVPIQVYIPTIQINQTGPAYAGPPRYNSSSPYNANYSSPNNGYRPPGVYLSNQYPNYPRYNNTTYPANYNGTQDGHLFVGNIQLYDRLLFNQVFKKERRWWASREKTIEYPAASPAGYTRHEVISAIRIYNQFLDGNTARASILKGGVGYQYVKIYLASGWNKGFQYLVQIYGH